MLDVLVRTPAGKVARRGLPIFRGKMYCCNSLSLPSLEMTSLEFSITRNKALEDWSACKLKAKVGI